MVNEGPLTCIVRSVMRALALLCAAVTAMGNSCLLRRTPINVERTVLTVTHRLQDNQWLKWRGTQGDAVPPPQIYGRMRSPTSGIPTDARGR